MSMWFWALRREEAVGRLSLCGALDPDVCARGDPCRQPTIGYGH